MPPTARIIDGRALAGAVRAEVAARTELLRRGGRRVRLDAVIAGDDGGALLYAQNQAATCAEVGIEYHLHRLDPEASFEDVAGRVLLLNASDEVTAIMVHLPLPAGVDTERVQSLIDPQKDVEGVNPANIGNVVYGRRSLVPCTALAVMEMIESTGISLPGRRCVVVGAGNIVGKPIAVLLMRAEATVTSTNRHTVDQGELTRGADVVVAAAGVPGLIRAEMVRPGAIVVDVGINRVRSADGRTLTVGDVAFDEVRAIAGWISPVPGGVGPMTVAMLLRNTVDAAGR
ncbi:MAG TPA: bifunctional 5,10-methylenetetrahydrofolate dehydrogenase/5,10-methenyltetrahydrofolate cyclohydrolase [Phycisphaerales bacterium]|nr:bifunctional 5,10-methylenetetrahydrofolate dehydrogenase/5,10-methenyltetrahydrofolate cyclohydrolase [Phycisphaerales bacterium]HMP37607.1 bifunctional 5,10-methylenetetrahydrofolate dehydrogenase/5,10-methenyltetrahydrofolate cyclohydrolase [Phycisphaerales bacterium]